jgi:hypothetical protein
VRFSYEHYVTMSSKEFNPGVKGGLAFPSPFRSRKARHLEEIHTPTSRQRPSTVQVHGFAVQRVWEASKLKRGVRSPQAMCAWKRAIDAAKQARLGLRMRMLHSQHTPSALRGACLHRWSGCTYAVFSAGGRGGLATYLGQGIDSRCPSPRPRQTPHHSLFEFMHINLTPPPPPLPLPNRDATPYCGATLTTRARSSRGNARSRRA